MVVAGLLVTSGVVLTIAAVRGVTLGPSRIGRRSKAALRFTPLHGAAVVAGVVVLAITGWPVAALATAAAVVFVPSVIGGGKESRQLITVSDALADWTRRLADLISSGAAGSTREALRRSLDSAPLAVRPAVADLVSRMGPQGVEPALRRFADDVGDPAADKIAMVLILRERNGGPGLAEVLTALAADLDERSRMIREVESERAKPRSNMRTIVITTGLVVIGMLLFARTFLSGYSSLGGQLALLLVAALFGAALRWMRSLSAPPTWPRVLADRSAGTTP
jgi:Flp pilus assembly protein TadB